MEMISKLGLLARALLLSSLGLCASRSSLGLAALRSPVPGVLRFSVRFLVAFGEARRHLHRQTALQLPAPARRGSSCGCDSPWLLGGRGTPLAPGGLGRPRRQTPKDDEAPLRHNGKERPVRAQTARTRRIPPRATYPARNLGVRTRRTTCAFPGVRTGTSPRRATGTSPRRATGTSQLRATSAVRRTATRARHATYSE